jgi:aspartyl-tRNA(Asn)/glutamyl-tRNA(Gln) amidotransferase subunit B
MPDLRQERFITGFGLTLDEARAVSRERDVADFFEAAAIAGSHPKKAANWIISQLVPALKEMDLTLSQVPLTPERFTALIGLLDGDEINAAAAKSVLVKMLSEDQPPEVLVDTHGFRQVSDTRALETIVEKVMADHPSDVQDYRSGNPKVMGFFMGQAMKAAQGKANPKLMKEILIQKLSQ